jgi:hypothetical protein
VDQVALVPPGLEIIDPGAAVVHGWRTNSDAHLYRDDQVGIYRLIACKP